MTRAIPLESEDDVVRAPNTKHVAVITIPRKNPGSGKAGGKGKRAQLATWPMAQRVVYVTTLLFLVSILSPLVYQLLSARRQRQPATREARVDFDMAPLLSW